jgi:hypothetical protein
MPRSGSGEVIGVHKSSIGVVDLDIQRKVATYGYAVASVTHRELRMLGTGSDETKETDGLALNAV